MSKQSYSTRGSTILSQIASILWPPALIYTLKAPWRSVLLSDAGLRLPTSHRRNVTIPLDAIACIGLTKSHASQALTVWTTEGRSYRSEAVCIFDGTEGRRLLEKVDEILGSIRERVREFQGPNGALASKHAC
jgi:hypothetical protein